MSKFKGLSIMLTEEYIINVYCLVDEMLKKVVNKEYTATRFRSETFGCGSDY